MNLPKLKMLDLFSGIGGFSLGLEEAGGFETVAHCEINPFCRKVLKKHWPRIPCYEDIRDVTAGRLRADGISIDGISGGFPCQDVSVAGNRLGLAGERSGLWTEYKRLVCELRPKFFIVENTPGLLSLGMGTVLGDVAELGYDAEWENIPAAFVGAEHMRERIWIVAYLDALRELQPQGGIKNQRRRLGDGSPQILTDAVRAGLSRWSNAGKNGGNAEIISARPGFADASAADASGFDWQNQPLLGRGIHAIPDRVDRVEALGNAVVPAIPQLIGEAIMAFLRTAED